MTPLKKAANLTSFFSVLKTSPKIMTEIDGIQLPNGC